MRIRRLVANIVRAAYMAHLLILLPRWLEIYDYGFRNGGFVIVTVRFNVTFADGRKKWGVGPLFGNDLHHSPIFSPEDSAG